MLYAAVLFLFVGQHRRRIVAHNLIRVVKEVMTELILTNGGSVRVIIEEGNQPSRSSEGTHLRPQQSDGCPLDDMMMGQSIMTKKSVSPNPTTTTTNPPVNQNHNNPLTSYQIPPFYACAQCHMKISDRYLLKAMDRYWHEDCLKVCSDSSRQGSSLRRFNKCGCCGCRLAEAGSSMFFKQNMLLCKRDYLRLFGLTGLCAACHKTIPAFEMVMRARENVYHLDCFACQQCHHKFCVGDRFYLSDSNKILCEYDYEERSVFAQMTAYNNYNSLAQIKRQFQQEDSIPDQQQSGGHQSVPIR